MGTRFLDLCAHGQANYVLQYLLGECTCRKEVFRGCMMHCKNKANLHLFCTERTQSYITIRMLEELRRLAQTEIQEQRRTRYEAPGLSPNAKSVYEEDLKRCQDAENDLQEFLKLLEESSGKIPV